MMDCGTISFTARRGVFLDVVLVVRPLSALAPEQQALFLAQLLVILNDLSRRP